MEMIILKARKDKSTIDSITVGITGTVKTHAKSSKKLKLKIVWLSAESVPPHFAKATMMLTKVIAAKGERKKMKNVGGNGFLY
jgi:hypothetical protein